MLTLFSTLISFLAGGLPKLLGFFQDRADKSHEYWGGLLHHLVYMGFLQQDVGNYSVLTLTNAARPLLRGEQTLAMAAPRVKPTSSTTKSTRRKSDDEDYDEDEDYDCNPCECDDPCDWVPPVPKNIPPKTLPAPVSTGNWICSDGGFEDKYGSWTTMEYYGVTKNQAKAAFAKEFDIDYIDVRVRKIR